MIKRIGIYSLVIFMLFIAIYSVHTSVLDAETLSFSLLSIYLFNIISSVLTYLAVELTFSKLPDQTGYAFLTAVFLKLGLFTVLFMSTLTSDRSLEMFEKISILIPFSVFLIAEAIGCFKLLSSTSHS